MFFHIYNFLFGLIARLLFWLGLRYGSDSSTAGPDTERTGPECAISENTALLSQSEDNEEEFLTGPDPASLWTPTAYDYREQSTPSTPSFQSAVRVPPTEEDSEDGSSSSSDSDSELDTDDEPPPYLARGKATRPSQGKAPSRAPHASGPGREPATARPVRPIAGPTNVPISTRPRPPPQPQYPRPQH